MRSTQATVEGFQKIGLSAGEGEDMLRRSVQILREARDQAVYMYIYLHTHTRHNTWSPDAFLVWNSVTLYALISRSPPTAHVLYRASLCVRAVGDAR